IVLQTSGGVGAHADFPAVAGRHSADGWIYRKVLSLCCCYRDASQRSGSHRGAQRGNLAVLLLQDCCLDVYAGADGENGSDLCTRPQLRDGRGHCIHDADRDLSGSVHQFSETGGYSRVLENHRAMETTESPLCGLRGSVVFYWQPSEIPSI